MPEPTIYGFSERLVFSNGVVNNATVENVLLQEIPGATAVKKASLEADKSGTDWWVTRHCGRDVSIDAKVRTKDYATRGKDDLALETFSVIESDKVGWTRDESKQTDYILWLWTDTGRWCLVPFIMLCSVFKRKWQDWKSTYGHSRQKTPWNGGYYQSECVFVPRREVWKEIYLTFSGQLSQGSGEIQIEPPQPIAIEDSRPKTQQVMF